MRVAPVSVFRGVTVVNEHFGIQYSCDVCPCTTYLPATVESSIYVLSSSPLIFDPDATFEFAPSTIATGRLGVSRWRLNSVHK